ncbi:MAG TPA: hypothetical protein VGF85_03855 [Opitutaceae bacterium]|jgi:hypothetical protein
MNISSRLFGTMAAALLVPFVQAASIPQDLGQGLTYYRIHVLPADLPSTPTAGPGACVVDLRFAKTDESAAAALKAWLKFNASPQAPIFVLENASTSPALLAAVGTGGPAGLLVIAPDSEGLAPDIAVHVSAEIDAKSYKALDAGTPIQALLKDNPEKPRVDEAYLEKEHLSDGDAPDAASDQQAPPGPLIDLVLQRAVQIDRGLLALKRL